MKKFKKLKRLILLDMMLVMLVGVFYNFVTATDGCVYHQYHDENCGFVASIEGKECTHEHDESCYTTGECSLEEHTHDDSCYEFTTLICSDEGHTHDASCYEDKTLICTLDEHIHDDTCNSKELTCTHEHDESCGYVASVEGKECEHLCSYCDDTFSRKGDIIVDEDNKNILHISTTLEGKKGEDDVYFYVGIPSTYFATLEFEKNHNDQDIIVDKNGDTFVVETYEDQNNPDIKYLKYQQKYNYTREFDLEFVDIQGEITLSSASSFNENDQHALKTIEILENKVKRSFLAMNNNNDNISLASASVDEYGISPMSEMSLDFSSQITQEVVTGPNGESLDGATVTEGYLVRNRINFELEPNFLANTNVLTYQVNNHIGLLREESGNVYGQNGEVLGVYHITKDGLITITVDDSIVEQNKNGAKIVGMIWFEGTIHKNNDSNESEGVTIGQTSFTIEAQPEQKKTDMKVNKEAGTLDPQTQQIPYTVTVSTVYGTPGEVQIVDTISGATYDEGSFMYDGQPIDSSQLVFENGKVTIKGLPQMGPDETHKITYTATVDKDQAATNGELKVTNNVQGNSGHIWTSDRTETKVQDKLIDKSGKPTGDGQIEWTINLTGVKAGEIFTDNIPAGQTYQSATVTLPDGTTQNVDLSSGSYTLPSDGNYTIKITTSTTSTPGLNEYISYSNTGTIAHDGAEYSATGTTGIPGPQAIQKRMSSKEETVEGTTYSWNVSLTIPENTGSYYYEDILTDNNASETIHYLKEGTQIAVLDSNDTAVDASKYQIVYIVDGQEVDTIPADTKVTQFKINFVAPISAGAYKIQYQSYGAHTMEPGNSNTYSNQGIAHIGDTDSYQSTSNDTYKKPKTFEKLNIQYDPNKVWSQFNNRPREYFAGTLTTDTISMNYNDTEGKLFYAFRLKTVPLQNDIVIVDTLPQGTKLVTEEGKFEPWLLYQYFKNGDGIGDYCTEAPWLNKPGVYIEKYLSYDYNETTNQVTFTISKNIMDAYSYETEMKNNPDSHILLGYCLDVPKSYVGQTTVNGYRNQAVCNGMTEQTDQNIINKPEFLKKTGTREGSKMHYSLLVNPAGADLIPDADKIKLVDQLQFNTNTTNYAVFINNSLKVYAYDNTTGQKGELLDVGMYTYRYDDDTKELHIELPDSIPVVVEYDYEIDVKWNTEITNKAEIEGLGESYTETKVDFDRQTSGGTIYGQIVKLIKVDQDHNGITLARAKFDLYTVSDNNKVQGDLITDKSGEIILKIDTGAIQKNVLYKVIETEAPVGYIKSETPLYFIVGEPGSTRDAVLNTLDSSMLANNNINKKDIYVLNGSGEIIIPNEYGSITARKIWTNSDGTVSNNHPESIQLQLKRATTETYEDLEDHYTITVKYYNGTDYTVDTYNVKQGQPFKMRVEHFGNQLDWTYNGEQVDNSQPWADKEFYEAGEMVVDYKNDIPDSNKYTLRDIVKIDTSTLAQIVTKDKEGELKDYLEPVTLDSSNNFMYTWDAAQVPQSDEIDGTLVKYKYFVEEVSVPAGWTVTYQNNGISSGNVVVTNKKDQQVAVLPEVGGEGTLIYVVIGVLLIGNAYIMVLKHRKKSG